MRASRPVSEGVAPGRVAIAAIVLIAVAVLVARGVTGVPVNHALAVAAAGALFILVFMRTELGLDVLLLSMLLSPEVVLGGKGGIAEQREVSIRLDDFIILIIAFTWFAKNAVYKELGLVQRTPLNRPIAAYATACLLATVWGVLWGRVSALSGLFYLLKYLEYFFVFYIVVNNVRTRQQARRLLSVALLTAALVSVVGIAQIPSGQRVSAPFEGESGEPNTLGGYLILMMAVAAGIASETRRAAVRLAGFGLALLMLVPFAYTLSRASYLALIPMSLCLVVLSSRRALLVPTFILALAAAPLVAPPVMRERIEYTFRPQANQPTVRVGQAGFDPSTSERLLSFKDALDAWTTKPLLGFGVTGFRFMDAQYPRTLVETGVVGFAAFAWMLWTLLRLAVSRLGAARGAESRGLVLGYLAGFVGLLVHAIGSNTFIIIRIMEPFWFLTGLVVVLPDLEAAPEAPPRSPPPSVRAIPPAPLRVALSPGSAGRRGG